MATMASTSVATARRMISSVTVPANRTRHVMSRPPSGLRERAHCPVHECRGRVEESAVYRVFEALDELVTILEEARGLPMTSSCVVPRGDVLELLDEVRDALPGEVDDAQDVLDRKDEIIGGAEHQAEQTLSKAKLEADQTLTAADTEADRRVAEATAHADRLPAEARAEADRMVNAGRAEYESLVSRA